jgi:hypothetical protein
MPDLVLVPALLSPQDDAALAAALRVIAAAAHVRTLTIPVLANESKTEAPSGLLSRWRRSRTASPAPDGCDPHVFAEQISAYLAEAAAERAALRRDDDDMGETPVVDRPVVDPAILEAAIVEAVSQSHAAASDDYRMADRAFDDHASADESLSDRIMADRPIVEPAPVDHASNGYSAGEQTTVDLPLLDYAAAVETIAEHHTAEQTITEHDIVDRASVETVDEHVTAPEPLFAAIETREHDSLVEARQEQTRSDDDFNTDEDIDLSSALFDGEPVRVYTLLDFAKPRAGGQPIVEEIVAAAPAIDEPVVEERGVEQVVLDETMVEDVVVAAVDELAVEELAADVTLVDEHSVDVAPVELLAADIAPVEEVAVDFASVEVVAAAAVSPLEEFAVDFAAVEAVAADARQTDELTIDEFAIDNLVVEDFSFEEIAADVPGAQDLVVTQAIDEPAVAPRVLEARAAFEQAEVMALADLDTDDAVLTEFADYAGPDPDDVEPWISASLARLYTWPVLEGVPAEIVIEPVKPEPARPLAAAATHTREREWTELVASLRQDIERRRVEPLVAKPKRPSKKAKPAQDEWGFFDPEQCGFAALLAKLDEITDPPDERELPRH